MVRRVTARVDVDADGAKQGAAETERSAGRIAGAFDGLKGKASGFKDQFASAMGSAQSAAKDKLGPLGDMAEKVGLDFEKLNPKALLAGGAIAGLTTFVAGGIAKFSALTNEVKAYTSAAGVSAEQGSRLNAVFKGLGVEAEDGADVLKTMGEIIGTDAEKFKTYGVEIVKAKDGTTDMVGTLGAVAERFREMTDPAQRAALGSELFGDSWVKIAPLLSGGKAELDDLLGSVSKSALVTDDAIKANDEMAKKLGEARQAIDALQIAAGKEALPELVEDLRAAVFVLEQLNAANDKVNFIGWGKDLADGMNPLKSGVELWQRWNDEQERTKGIDLAPTIDRVASAMLAAAGEAKPLADAERDAARAAEEQARKTADTVTELEALEKAVDDATAAYERAQGAVVTTFEAQLRYDDAVKAAEDAMTATTSAAEALTTATSEHGAESEEATKAQGDYSKALEDAEKRSYDQAAAAVELARKQAEVSGATLTTAEANQIYRDKLVAARDATNDPVLKDALTGRIADFDALSVNANDSATNVATASTKLNEAKTAAGDPVLHEALDIAATKFGALAWNAREAAAGMADAALRAAADFTPSFPAANETDYNAFPEVIGGRAAGGPVLSGQSYVIGERGPELFTPGATGFVTPPDRFDRQVGPGAPLVVQFVMDGRQFAESAIPHLEVHRRSTQ